MNMSCHVMSCYATVSTVPRAFCFFWQEEGGLCLHPSVRPRVYPKRLLAQYFTNGCGHFTKCTPSVQFRTKMS